MYCEHGNRTIIIYTIMHPEVMLFIADTNNDTKYKKNLQQNLFGYKTT